MNHIYLQHYKTPYGELSLGAFNDQLCLCDWRYRKKRNSIDSRIVRYLKANFVELDHPILELTRLQLEQYFTSEREIFEIPLLFAGTDFQKSIWNELLKVSYGETSTYLDLAISFGNQNAVRAVANANGANAISIIVPCHRIIGSNGQLVGYAGGLKAKQALLSLEQKEPGAREQLALDI